MKWDTAPKKVNLSGESGLTRFEDLIGVDTLSVNSLDSFRYDISQVELGTLNLSRFVGSAISAERNGKRLKALRQEELHIGLRIRGHKVIEQQDRQGHVRAGDMFAINADDAYRFSAETTDQILLQIPMEQLGAEKDSIKNQAGRPFPRTPLVSAAGAFLSTYFSDSMTKEVFEHHSEAAIALVDIVRSILAESAGRLRLMDDMESYLMNRVHRIIQANFRNPELTPELIASVAGLSTRTLYRHFEREGKSVRGHIEELRVEHAIALLSNPYLTLAEVAAKSGFGATHKMRRAFLRRFQMTPLEYRATGLKD